MIKLTFGGDVNITDASVAAGLINGNYNFTEVFRDVVPALADADLTVLNFEGNLCGAPYGSQSASAPQALVEALKKLSRDNFAHLAPSKLQVLLEYSHPPLSQRIAAIEKEMET